MVTVDVLYALGLVLYILLGYIEKAYSSFPSHMMVWQSCFYCCKLSPYSYRCSSLLLFPQTSIGPLEGYLSFPVPTILGRKCQQQVLSRVTLTCLTILHSVDKSTYRRTYSRRLVKLPCLKLSPSGVY